MKAELTLQLRYLQGLDGDGAASDQPNPGLVVVFSGAGKGKSTAAFGMGMRALKQNMKLGVVQFLGGSCNSAEYQTLGQDPLCEFKFFGGLGEIASDQNWLAKGMAQPALAQALAMLQDPSFKMVILDEINQLLHYRYYELDIILNALRTRPQGMHVILTGRRAPYELLDFADVATLMQQLVHPFPEKKIAAQAGIEF